MDWAALTTVTGGGGDVSVEEIGYGPYASSDGYLTVEGTADGLLIKKTNPSQDGTIMVYVWEYGDFDVAHIAYSRVFYNWSSGDSTDVDEFTYEYVREGVVYGVMLITWEEYWGGTQFDSESMLVRAAGGKGDFREVVRSASYDSATTTLSFDVTLEAPSDIDTRGLLYSMTIYPEDQDEYCYVYVYGGTEAKLEFDLSKLSEYEGHIKGNSFTVAYSTYYAPPGDATGIEYHGNIMLTRNQVFQDTN